MPVEKGNMVTVEYEGSFDDGNVFDSSEKHGKPLVFIAGAGQVIKGFDEALIGMEKDEEKKETLLFNFFGFVNFWWWWSGICVSNCSLFSFTSSSIDLLT